MLKATKKVSGLTKKHQIFIAEYLACLDATKAAIKAGYSKKSAQSLGCQLLKHPKVSAEIAKKTGKRLANLEITADRVLNEIAKLSFYDPRDLFESDGSPKQIKDLDDITAMAVSGLEVCELFEGAGDQKHAYGLVKKIKLADKGANLERLGRHFKLFTDKKELSGPNGGPIEVKERTDADLEYFVKHGKWPGE